MRVKTYFGTRVSFRRSIFSGNPSGGCTARQEHQESILDKHIRKIFSLFALVMIGLFIFGLVKDVWSNLNWAMLAVGGLVCVLVFRNFVYIFNFSYALACMLNGALLAAWFANAPAILLAGT